MRTRRFIGLVGFWTVLGFVLIVSLILAPVCRAQGSEEKTAKYMESVRHQPGLLLAFLQQMPKGGDLHVHLSGAIYAESFIDWASENALCVDRSTSKLIHAACDSCEPYKVKPSVRCAYKDPILYDQLIDAWSMRNWHGAEESGTIISLERSTSLVPRCRTMWGTRLPRWRRARRPIMCSMWK